MQIASRQKSMVENAVVRESASFDKHVALSARNAVTIRREAIPEVPLVQAVKTVLGISIGP